MPHTDVFIIGGGPAGLTLANLCRDGGLDVTIADAIAFGGTCTYRGCAPKRIMASVSESIDSVDRLVGHGVRGEAQMAWPEVKRLVDGYLDGHSEGIVETFEGKGIRALLQRVTVTGPGTLEAGGQTYTADHVVVATGQRPAPLGIPGEEHANVSSDFHELPEMPRRVLFIGGGYIGLESAHIAARSGSEVTIVNNDDDPLPMFEPDLVEVLLDASRELGIDFHFNQSAKSIEREGDAFRVTTEDADGGEHHYTVDLVLNTAGRIANVEGFGLEALGAEVSGKGVAVDECFRVEGVDGLYAIGDVGDDEGPPLTPVAQIEAKALANTILTGDPTPPDYSGLPTAVYTLPELACVGLMESEARDAGYDVEVVQKLNACEQFNAYRMRARAYAYKTIVDKESGKLLGAHVLSPHASEVINVFALTIRAGLPAKTLKDVPWAYPTWGSDVSGMV